MTQKSFSDSTMFRQLLMARFELNRNNLTDFAVEALDLQEMRAYLAKGYERPKECLQRMLEMIIVKDTLSQPEQRFMVEILPYYLDVYESIMEYVEEVLPGILEKRRHDSWAVIRVFYSFED